MGKFIEKKTQQNRSKKKLSVSVDIVKQIHHSPVSTAGDDIQNFANIMIHLPKSDETEHTFKK
jgi:hypothetical protein